MTRTPFADLLAHYRTRVRLSQSRLAEAAGYDHSYVSRLETGARNPTRDNITAFARALALDPPERDRLLASAGFLPDSELLQPIRRPALRTRPAPGMMRSEVQLLNRLWRDHRDPADDAEDPGPTDLRPQRPAENVPERRIAKPDPRPAIRPMTDAATRAPA